MKLAAFVLCAEEGDEIKFCAHGGFARGIAFAECAEQAFAGVPPQIDQGFFGRIRA